MFDKNLNSIYKSIPVNRLLIGDAGCTNSSIEVLGKYPRFEVYDQKEYKTFGRCFAD